MENMAVLILGIILSLLPAEGFEGAQERIKEEVGPGGVSISAEAVKTGAGAVGFETLRVVLYDWETDGGTADRSEFVFHGIEATERDGGWMLRKSGLVDVVLEMDEEKLWEAVSGGNARVQVTGLRIEDGRIEIESKVQLTPTLPPLDVKIGGVPALNDDNYILLHEPVRAEIMKLDVSSWAGSYLLELFNPVLDIEQFDIISTFISQYMDTVKFSYGLEMNELKIEKEILIVKGVLTPAG